VSRRFAWVGDDAIRVTLVEPEVELLRALPEQLRALYEVPAPPVTGGAVDPVRDRLFPRAYLDPTAEDAEAEWRALVHPDLVRDRIGALGLLTASLDATTARRRGKVTLDLAEDEVAAWLSVLNDARLVLGIRLQITEDVVPGPLDPTDPEAQGLAAYAWLTDVQSELVEALLPRLPDGDPDGDPD
jgi:hypothetical protein